MEWLVSTEMDVDCPEFTLAEVLEMERVFKKRGEESRREEFCQELANKFSCSTHRVGKSTIEWEQVQKWFQDKQKLLAIKNSVVASNARTNRAHAINSSPPESLKALVRFANAQSAAELCLKPMAERVAELSELVFEALSSKDSAWYDVAAFLNYRVLCTGELEVRVRFAGFMYDQDEWVNVRRGIRERSIPLEPSECYKVKVADPVLAYRANDDHALYSDAHVVDIQREMHDDKVCTCIFVVCFEYDNAEDQLRLSEICCRAA